MKSDKILIVKLMSGETYLIHTTEASDGFYVADCVLTFAMNPAGQVAIIPEPIFTENGQPVKIYKNTIAMIAEAGDKLKDKVKQICLQVKAAQSGIVIAKEEPKTNNNKLIKLPKSGE